MLTINEEFVIESSPYLCHAGLALLWSTMTQSSCGKLHVHRIHIVVLEWTLVSRRRRLLFREGRWRNWKRTVTHCEVTAIVHVYIAVIMSISQLQVSFPDPIPEQR